MGKNSDLSDAEKLEVVLMLLRREEPAAELEKQLGKRDRLLGELTVANRILKKLSGGLS